MCRRSVTPLDCAASLQHTWVEGLLRGAGALTCRWGVGNEESGGEEEGGGIVEGVAVIV